MGPTGRRIARVQRLCCLELGGQVLMPYLMQELQALIPSRGNAFFWAGPHLELAGFYTDQADMVELAPLYLGEFHNSREREVVATFSEYMRQDYSRPVSTWLDRVLKVDPNDFVKSAFYNEILRTAGWEHVLQVQIKTDARKLGALQIARSRDAKDFTRRDIDLLTVLAPFIAHGLTAPSRAEPFVESEERALVIADSSTLQPGAGIPPGPKSLRDSAIYQQALRAPGGKFPRTTREQSLLLSFPLHLHQMQR